MNEILKKPYEISLWDDVLTFVLRDNLNGTEIEVPSAELKNYNNHTIVNQYYKEEKICIIGSDTMDTPVRAVQGKLNAKINGETNFTFSIYSHYYDEETDSFFTNPFTKLLVNERKVKLRYGPLGDCKWYDFIIKNIQENSENKTYTYTCKSLFVNELSKTGFNIQLDTELENNMGKVEELAEYILAESDWTVRGNSNLKQYREEPLYVLTTSQSIQAKNLTTATTQAIPKDSEILVFYSVIQNKEPFFQFLYIPPFNGEISYEIDQDYIIANEDCQYGIELDGAWGGDFPDFIDGSISLENLSVSDRFRGNRLVRQQLMKYDSVTDKYVNVYHAETSDDESVEVYGYTETEYISPAKVKTLITNGQGFKNLSGWNVSGARVEGKTVLPSLKVESYPEFGEADDYKDATEQARKNYQPDMYYERTGNNSYAICTDNEFTEGKTYYLPYYASLLKFTPTSGYGDVQTLMNTGLMDHRHQIKQLTEGTEYILRIKGRTSRKPTEQDLSPEESDVFGKTKIGNIEIATYELEDGIYDIIRSDPLFKIGTKDNSLEWGVDGLNDLSYSSITATCLKSIPEEEFQFMRLGIFFTFNPQEGTDFYLEDVQFFEKVTNDNGEIYLLDTALEPTIKTVYQYYQPAQDLESIVYLSGSGSEQPNPNYVPAYNTNQFEKVRSITAKESNRFNLIQELCETFECWADFIIEHDPQTGRIKLGKDVGKTAQNEKYRQQKFVQFKESHTVENQAGFRYGVNLKSITRTLNSDGVVSKLIVKNNANEFANNGFCSIARAKENYTKENFILDFSYYIQHRLIDFDAIQNDLYSESNQYLGYYRKLRQANASRDNIIEQMAQLLTDISNYESSYKTYYNSVEEANGEILRLRTKIQEKTGFTPEELQMYGTLDSELGEEEQKARDWWENTETRADIAALRQAQSVVSSHSRLRDLAQSRLDHANSTYETLNEELQTLTEQKKNYNKEFYQKYSRFIQEGSWISEDYTDDNLYFLDAENTARTSAFPKVTYNINVIELSQLDGYENYQFALGDKTYIEDTEFFGWTKNEDNGIWTPYQEEVIVSELTIELDSPEKNVIKVQNYKTQFEDLFQRIAATTQSVEYHTGEYARATTVIQPDGTINATSLQNSIANNSLRLENAKDQSVVIDEFGITTTSLSAPSQMLRLVSGGLFVSNDGGITWNTGVTGDGMNANFLTAGQINTDKISIYNGGQPSFRWDGSGISAYNFQVNQATGEIYGINNSKFVRFDKYGVYGISNHANFSPTSEEDIWNAASTKFALTWKGFLLKNEDGSVKISSDEDIQVFEGEEERIKIGRIGDDLYGIRISNNSGAVMETDNNGDLWLKSRLSVQTSGNNEVGIGAIQENGSTHGNQVINANNDFIVYEDGHVKAMSGEFSGSINATSGTIGGEGLTVQNGAFKILDGKDWVFYADDNGDLNLTGNITAIGGTIGGFIINNNRLISVETDDNGQPAIQLIGGDTTSEANEGKIIAKTIELGNGAIVQDYIAFSNDDKVAYIYNPQTHEDLWLKADGLSIYTNGKMEIGNITIDGLAEGGSGYLKANNNNWKISGDGRAEFNDIYADNCHFRKTIMEVDTVQASGNLTIFADSWTIKDVEGNYIILDRDPLLAKGDTLFINGQYYNLTNEVEKVDGEELWRVPLKGRGATEITGQISKGDIVVRIGKEDDLVFSITGQSNAGPGFSKGNALVLSRYGGWDNMNFNHELVLGSLEGLSGASGFGLYSENVFLRGSLTTTSQSGEETIYSGINTISGINAIFMQDGFNSSSIAIPEKVGADPIVFWAGAKSDKAADIQQAPFQVSRNGHLFAASGIFTGSIISNSEIYGADIYAAHIHGWQDGAKAALTISDSAEGIVFMHGENKALSIKENSLQTGSGQSFIVIQPGVNNDLDRVNFFGQSGYFQEDDKSILINYEGINWIEKTSEGDSNKGAILFDTADEKIVFKQKEQQIITANLDTTLISSANFQATQSVKYGDDLNGLHYQSVNGGYDLFVRNE